MKKSTRRAFVDTDCRKSFIAEFGHWDGLILAAAKEASCEILYSEDLQHEQIYDGINVVNPFS